MGLDDRVNKVDSPLDERRIGRVVVGNGMFIRGSYGDCEDLEYKDLSSGDKRVEGDIGIHEYSSENSFYRNSLKSNGELDRTISRIESCCVVGCLGVALGSMVVVGSLGYLVYKYFSG
jgi:hypothetical protein|tara:strand:+ start:2375 stop:2728 length:354 start_codon:yes stop_codon:yes gene_type:complete